MLMRLLLWLAGPPPVRDERGWSISTEQLLWIIGIIAMVAVVVAALNGYIASQLARIG